MKATGSVVVPVLGGALAATAGALLLKSWPGLPPDAVPAATAAAVALLVVPILLLIVAARMPAAAVVREPRPSAATRRYPSTQQVAAQHGYKSVPYRSAPYRSTPVPAREYRRLMPAPHRGAPQLDGFVRPR